MTSRRPLTPTIHIIEDIIAVLDKGYQGIKRFKILQHRYRNKQRKHLLFYNFS